MRLIKKRKEPKELSDWKAENERAGRSVTYKDLPGEVKRIVGKSLLSEQGHLCAYTMMRLGDNDFHIEHFLPQHAYPHHAVDYENLLACFPNKQTYGTKEGPCPFGADYKDNSTEHICNPTVAADVQNAFTFRVSGEVIGNTELARKTIEVLNLNHHRLIRDRKTAILRAMGVTENNGKCNLGAKEALRLAQIYSEPSEVMRPFCIAVAQCLERFAKHASQRSQRMKKEH